jgi:hypothetical protein
MRCIERLNQRHLFTHDVTPATHTPHQHGQLCSHSITCRHSNLLHAGMLHHIAVLLLVLCALLVALLLVPVVPVCHLALSRQQHALSNSSSKEPAHMAERSTKHSNH